MPLDELQKRILDEARAKARQIEGEGEKMAESITGDAAKEAKERKAMIGEELERETERLRVEHDATTQMEVSRTLLIAKEQAAEGEMQKLKSATVRRVKAKGYKSIFDEAIEKAVQIATMEKLVFIVNKADEQFVRGLGGKIENGKMSGGLIIVADKGRVRIDATLDTLFEKRREALKAMLLKSMFGEKRPRAKKTEAAEKAARAKKTVTKRNVKKRK